MDKVKELDIKVAGITLSRAISEIVYCSYHPDFTGPHRLQEAHKTFGEAVVNLVKLLEK